MSLDLGTALQVAVDVAQDAKNPASVVSDAWKIYRVVAASPAGKSALSKVADVLEGAGDAVVDLAPTLVAVLKDPAQKAQLVALLRSAP